VLDSLADSGGDGCAFVCLGVSAGRCEHCLHGFGDAVRA
jgi:hypothetical protein